MLRLRVFPVVATLLAGSLLAGCSGGSNFDPTSLLDSDLFSTKTPLPGDRKPVFPEGVPGVPQGVPKEMVKGSQQQQQAAVELAEPPPAEAAPAKPAPKPAAARPAPKPRTASAPPVTRPVPQQQPAQRPATNQPTAEWPDGNAVHPPEANPRPAAPSSDANWPPPDSSTFSR